MDVLVEKLEDVVLGELFNFFDVVIDCWILLVELANASYMCRGGKEE